MLKPAGVNIKPDDGRPLLDVLASWALNKLTSGVCLFWGVLAAVTMGLFGVKGGAGATKLLWDE